MIHISKASIFLSVSHSACWLSKRCHQILMPWCEFVHDAKLCEWKQSERGSSLSQRSVSDSPDAIKQMQTCRWSASEKKKSAL